MTAPAVGLGTLERLSKLGGDGRPVMSVYLNLDAGRLSTPAVRDADLEALIANMAQPAPAADVSRLRQALRSMTIRIRNPGSCDVLLGRRFGFGGGAAAQPRRADGGPRHAAVA